MTRSGTKLVGALGAALLATAALAPADAQAEQVLRFATLQGVGQPSYDGAVRLAELVAERSNGELEVELFPDGQLGTEQESIEGVQFGTIDMFMGSTGAVGRFLPKLEAFAHPYVWRDLDHMLAVVRGEIGEELTEELRAQTGVRILDMGWLFGRRHLTTRETPVRVAIRWLTIGFASVVLIWQGIGLAERTVALKYPAMGISRAFLYGAVPVCFALLLINLVRSIRSPLETPPDLDRGA